MAISDKKILGEKNNKDLLSYPEIPYIKFLYREEINSIPVKENEEKMIWIPITDRLLLRNDSSKWLVPKLRQTVVNMLVNAAEALPYNYKLKVMSAYISIELQQELWNRKMIKTKDANPTIVDPMELEKLNRRYAAYPTKGAPHNTGGAVDVILLDENGHEIDMGSVFRGVGQPSHTRYAEIDDDAKYSRQILYWTMVNAGFLNTNPFEWWHYSYGDRAWAAYAKEQIAFYGGVEE